MKMFSKMAAQGDLLIMRIEKLPEGVVEVPANGGHYILAHSETGHHHVIERSKTALYRLPEEIYEAFLVVSQDAVIEHRRSFDTHHPLKVEPGIYKIKRQREYTPQGYRRAQD